MNVERLSHFAVIGVCILAAGLLVERRFSTVLGGNGVVKVEAGGRLPISGVNWSDAHRTIVIAISTGCVHCEQSAPFYKDIAARVRKSGSHSPNKSEVSFVVLGREPVGLLKRYVADRGITADAILQVDFAAAGISATPTLLIVNDRGIVEAAYVGRLTEEEEKRLFAEFGWGLS